MIGASNPLSGMNVLDPQGNLVPVETLWRDAHAVIGFVRHFG
jgi:hypothetical protein